MKVQVLLSCFNGVRWIREQLDSLLQQSLTDLGILVRDDGSDDGTQAILEEYRQKGFLQWYTGEHLGASRSFWHLLQNSTDADYYAFCDQDDVWDTDKLETAVRMLGQTDPAVPALYCSDVRVTDSELHTVSRHMVKEMPVDYAHALIRNAAPGCTFVFNHSARDVLKIYDAEKSGLRLHDWTVFQIVACFGTVIFDPETHMSYRQHGDNAIGAHQHTFRAMLGKIPAFLNGPQTNSRQRQAERLEQTYADRMGPDARELTGLLAHYREDRRIRGKLLQVLHRRLGYREYLPAAFLIRIHRF